MVRVRSSVATALVVAAALGGTVSAHAQSAGDKAAAESLFEEARRLMSQNKFAEACPKFEASERLDPAPGTQLNLADCSDRAGKTASAWVQFLEAASLSKNAGDPKREKAARDRAASLEPKLVRLNVAVSAAVASLPSLEITRDGAHLDRALWGTAVPVDPGSHTIEAVATGKKRWSGKVDASTPGKTATLEIPALDDAPVTTPIAPPPSTPASAPATTTSSAPTTSPTQAPLEPASSWSTQRTFALVAGGVGVVGLALGSVFGLGARSKWSDAQSHCLSGTTGCDDQAASLSHDAKSEGNLSTVFFVIGAAGIAGGAALWFTAPGGSPSKTGSSFHVTPDIASNHAGLQLGGNFLCDECFVPQPSSRSSSALRGSDAPHFSASKISKLTPRSVNQAPQEIQAQAEAATASPAEVGAARPAKVERVGARTADKRAVEGTLEAVKAAPAERARMAVKCLKAASQGRPDRAAQAPEMAARAPAEARARRALRGRAETQPAGWAESPGMEARRAKVEAGPDQVVVVLLAVAARLPFAATV